MESDAAARQVKRLRFSKNVEGDCSGLRKFHNVSKGNSYFARLVQEYKHKHSAGPLPNVFITHWRVAGLLERETGRIVVRSIDFKLLKPGSRPPVESFQELEDCQILKHMQPKLFLHPDGARSWKKVATVYKLKRALPGRKKTTGTQMLDRAWQSLKTWLPKQLHNKSKGAIRKDVFDKYLNSWMFRRNCRADVFRQWQSCAVPKTSGCAHEKKHHHIRTFFWQWQSCAVPRTSGCRNCKARVFSAVAKLCRPQNKRLRAGRKTPPHPPPAARHRASAERAKVYKTCEFFHTRQRCLLFGFKPKPTKTQGFEPGVLVQGGSNPPRSLTAPRPCFALCSPQRAVHGSVWKLQAADWLQQFLFNLAGCSTEHRNGSQKGVSQQDSSRYVCGLRVFMLIRECSQKQPI